MASKRRLRRKGENKCKNKTTYSSQAQAKESAKKSNFRQRQEFATSNIQAYKCQNCGGWHIGHRESMNRKISRDQKRRSAG